MGTKRRSGLQNNRKKFNDLLGEDIKFFNKIETKPEHREQALEHEDTCTCDACKIKALRLRLDKRTSG